MATLPSKFFHFFFLLILASSQLMMAAAPILLLSPFGSRLQPGRMIDGISEHERSLSIAQQLRELLSADSRISAYVATRTGKLENPQKLISITNSIENIFFLAINLYHETAIKPCLQVCYRSYNPLTDALPFRQQPTDFIPLGLAYRLNFRSSERYAQALSAGLGKSSLVSCGEVRGIPLAQLVGIKHAACSLEIGINKDHDLDAVVLLIAQQLAAVLEKELF